MDAVSPAIAARALKIESAVLKALADESQTRIAAKIGVDPSVISRFKDGDLARAAAVFAACGLKVVPADAKLYESDIMHALTTLARGRLQGIAGPEDLACD